MRMMMTMMMAFSPSIVFTRNDKPVRFV